MSSQTAQNVVQHVITTPAYRAGQKAAWEDFDRDPETRPNPDALRMMAAEFRLGYLDEFENFITPVQHGAPRPR